MLPVPAQSMIQNMPALCIVRPLRVTFAHWLIMIACAPVPLTCMGMKGLSQYCQQNSRAGGSPESTPVTAFQVFGSFLPTDI